MSVLYHNSQNLAFGIRYTLDFVVVVFVEFCFLFSVHFLYENLFRNQIIKDIQNLDFVLVSYLSLGRESPQSESVWDMSPHTGFSSFDSILEATFIHNCESGILFLSLEGLCERHCVFFLLYLEEWGMYTVWVLNKCGMSVKFSIWHQRGWVWKNPENVCFYLDLWAS